MQLTTSVNNKICLALVDWRLPVCGADAVRVCAEHRVDALQLDFGGPGRAPCLDDVRRQDAIMAACDEYGVNITALAGNQLNEAGLGLPHDSAGRLALQKIMISMLDLAKRFSASLVFFPSFYRGLIRDQETLGRTARMLAWACREARDRGLIIGNENDLSIAWARQLAAEVNAENFRLIFDSYNPVKAGHKTIEMLEQMSGCFASQVHIKDGIGSQDGKIRLGSGEGNIRAILARLVKTDWVERYVIENDYRDGELQRLADDITWLHSCLASEQERRIN
jgi:L-ribulose-5-phosphate 3-epimerase